MNKIIISCEHGGNKIPKEYNYLFKENYEILTTHKGYDPGALELSQLFFKAIGDYYFYSRTSRLLIELNRSLNNKNLFSSFTKNLPFEEKNKIINKYYSPYRNKIENTVTDLIKKNNSVIHFSIHTFTPTLNGKIRNTDIGLLFDPKREFEKSICKSIKKSFKKIYPQLKIRFNYPYLGISDGMTTYLRKKFPINYCGIELEVNQKFFTQETPIDISKIILKSFKEALNL